MKLKAQDLYNAVLILSAIMRERRAMPFKGSYRIARMHALLKPEWDVLNKKRDELIEAYNHKAEIKDKDGTVLMLAEQFSVPNDKLPEFNAAWKEIGDMEIEVANLEPIPVAQLDLGEHVPSAIHAGELLDLGNLVEG